MTKLAIVQEREEDKYDHQTTLKCWKCDAVNGKTIAVDEDTVRIFAPLPSLVFVHTRVLWQTRRLTDGIMQSLSSARQSEVKAWEEEINACEHTLLIEQLASGPIPAEGRRSISERVRVSL